MKNLSRKLARVVVSCILTAEIGLAAYVVYLFVRVFLS